MPPVVNWIALANCLQEKKKKIHEVWDFIKSTATGHLETSNIIYLLRLTATYIAPIT